MSNFKASAYQILIQESEIEGENYFVGSVMEIPDVAVYEDTYAAAYEAITQVLEDLYLAAQEESRPFPSPLKRNESLASGRVTLRLPKTLHATLERQAKAEETSLNQHLLYLLADASARVNQESHVNVVRSRAIRAVAPSSFSELKVLDIGLRHILRGAVVNAKSVPIAKGAHVFTGASVDFHKIEEEIDDNITFEVGGMSIPDISYARN